MSDLQRRSGSRMTRKQREARAYRLTLATGGLAVVFVVTLVLAVVGIVGFGAPVVAAILAGVSGWLLRGTLNP
ncbi:hypothetical protein [Patulibacter sp. SYSU D01012]|uniref:hypothetical protein n=1 Tax=Patulibacter sp. SYSU D01012 TaxID=2817381 RepID=UPI001B302C28|nr:hypothetical protein [Patulibacter sp. SYSU D01012]